MTQELNIPKHIAIIMDGNGKWARSKLLPKNVGHKKGAAAAEKMIKACKELGVEFLTLYAFSTENWNRPKEEVDNLISLFRQYIKEKMPQLVEQNIKVQFIGSRDRLPVDIQASMQHMEMISINNPFTLIMAVSYGSRDDIRTAALNFAKRLYDNDRNPTEADISSFDSFLSTYSIPDPDLLIRTGGEIRVSNFLLWELSYTELYFTPVLWPEFGQNDLIHAIKEYSRRERKYGS